MYYYGALFSRTVDVSKYGFSSYQWISVLNTNPQLVVNGHTLSNPIVDGTRDANGNDANYPFYYMPTDKFMYGNFSLFVDNPGTTHTNYTFSATTTLVGINGVLLTPIMSFTWGYQVTNGVTTLSPLGVTNYKVP